MQNRLVWHIQTPEESRAHLFLEKKKELNNIDQSSAHEKTGRSDCIWANRQNQGWSLEKSNEVEGGKD
jgi:hypothetical protein